MSLYRPVTIGPLKLSGNLFLAPVAGYTDRVFRSICAEYGADFGFTELVSAEALVRDPARYGLKGPEHGDSGSVDAQSVHPLLARGAAERQYAVQLFGAESETLGRAASLLASLRPAAIDLNAGCPVPKVVKTGAGAALMRDPARLGRIVRAMVKAGEAAPDSIPITVKIRSGWDEHLKNCAECARIAVEEGAAMITLHPRTRVQQYGGKSEWPLIAGLVSRLSVPVTGSGDLFAANDAAAMLEQTGCAAVMFARGALGNPFIFTETRAFLTGESGGPPPERPGPVLRLRLQTALRHLEGLAADLGEKSACLEMRKQFCAYTKGIAAGSRLRERIVRAETIAEYRTIFEPIR